MNFPNTRQLSIVTFVFPSVTFKLRAWSVPLLWTDHVQQTTKAAVTHINAVLQYTYSFIWPMSPVSDTFLLYSERLFDFNIARANPERVNNCRSSTKSEWQERKWQIGVKIQLWYGFLMAHLCCLGQEELVRTCCDCACARVCVCVWGGRK